jgi:hypothetical protein
VRWSRAAQFGEVSEWFKELVLKTSDSERDRGFESHLLRWNAEQSVGFYFKGVCSCRHGGFVSQSGEVPKRLKGHPWKGCRSLIAARGFKSLLLRSLEDTTGSFENMYKKDVDRAE